MEGRPDTVEPDDAPEAFARAVFTVAMLNLAYFGVEGVAAWRIGSVSLFADSIDFLEDASLNMLVLLGMALALPARARLGMAMAGLLLVPSGFAARTAWDKFLHPAPPEALTLSAVGLGALVVNVFCAFLLVRFRRVRGSMTQAAFLSARNDALANVAIVGAGLVTMWLLSGWPDLIVGVGIVALNADAALKVFRAARREAKSARAATQ